MKVSFHPLAADEYEQVADYYEIQRENKGIEFADEIDRICKLLADVQIGPMIDTRHRRIAMQGFPYGIIYRTTGEEVMIVAVAHNRRRPNWFRRT